MALLSVLIIPAAAFAQSEECVVDFEITSTSGTLGALSFEVDSAATPGSFKSLGCTLAGGIPGLVDGNVDTPDILNVSWADLSGIATPTSPFASCTFVSTVSPSTVTSGDLAITVIDASNPSATPVGGVTVEATVGGCIPVEPACGNSVAEAGEPCDGGDGCTIACRAAGSCPASPIVPCATSDLGKAQLKLKDNRKDITDTAKDQAQAKFQKVNSDITGTQVGDPSDDRTYTFCTYDSSGLVFGADIDGGDPFWACKLDKPGKEQCKYKNKDGNAYGVSGAKVKAGIAGKGQAAITLKTKLGQFFAPEMPLGEPGVIAQIHNDGSGFNRLCVGAEFPLAKKNDGVKGQFQAKGP